MPPDRTPTQSEAFTSGPAAAARYQGKSSIEVLHRNAACLTCRARKVKCDATRPSCWPCRKSALVQNKDPNEIVCTYDDASAEESTKKSRPRPRKVNVLENKIAELEQLIRANVVPQAPPAFPPGYAWPYPPPPPHAYPGGYPGYPMPPPNYPLPMQPVYPQPPTQPSASTSTGPSPAQSSVSSAAALADLANSAASAEPAFPGLDHAERQDSQDIGSWSDLLPASATQPVADFDFDDSLFADSLTALLYPGWPNDAPSPAIVTKLCEQFFDTDYGGANGLVNRARFFAALTLPPTHGRFPSTALLHAICGFASLYFTQSDDPLDLWRETYWRAEPTPGDYHLRQAKVHIDDATVNGTKLFQVAQAAVLVCFCSYAKARFVEVWLYCGLVTRISTPLGLNHLEGVCANRQQSETGSVSVRPILLEPPVDEIERHERAMTFWWALCCDRVASANTGWAMAISEDDITTLLPNEATKTSTERPSIKRIDALDIRSPGFFSSHPPAFVRSAGMLIKSVILMGRVNCFLQRAPYPIGSRTGEHIGGAIPDLRDSVAFKRLDADSVAFRLSFPRDLRAGYTGKRAAAALTDTNIILAHQVAHSATIILHEVWCTASPGDASMQRCMQSATAILASLGHKDAARMARLNPFLTFCWSIAGRTLIRQKAIYDHHGDTANAARLARDIAAVIDAIAAISPGGLAASIAGSLRQLAGNSASSLPQFGTPVVPYDTCDPFAKPGPSVHDFPPPLYDPSPVQSATVSDRPTTPGVNASAFLLNIEQEHDAGKVMTADELRQLLEPWVDGSASLWPPTLA